MDASGKLVTIASVVFGLRFLVLAAFHPYLYLWLEQNGFGTHERGVLGGVSSVVRFFAPMMLGFLADWLGSRRTVLFVALTVVNSLAIASLTLAPSSRLAQAGCLVVGALSDCGTLVDAFVMRSLAWAGKAGAAPGARSWGAVSWCIAAPLCGLLADSLGIAALFYAYSLLQLLLLPVILLLPIREAYSNVTQPGRSDAGGSTGAGGNPEAAGSSGDGGGKAGDKNHGEKSGEKDGDAVSTDREAPAESFCVRMRRALCGGGRRGKLLCFALPLLSLVGLNMGIGFVWGFIYLKRELHAPGVLVGLSLTAQAAIEVPLFRAASRLVNALGGLRTALLSTSLAAALRFSGWWVAPSPWAVLPFEVGHGWSFALAYTSIAVIGDEFARDGLQATVVGLLSSAMQLGQLGATFGWGFVVEAVGLRSSFAVAAATFGIAACPLPFACAFALCARWRRSRDPALIAAGSARIGREARGRTAAAPREAGVCEQTVEMETSEAVAVV